MIATEPSAKYPRTLHLPWSDTIGPDGDHVLTSTRVFAGQEVVVTEKLDGENTTLYAHIETQSNESIPLVPQLFRGIYDERKIRALQIGHSAFGGQQEGYVVRLSRGFSLEEWPRSIAKYVRPNHVQTGAHWMFKIVEKNGLASD